MRFTSLVLALSLMAPNALLAEQMSGQAVADMMAAGKLRFKAGSVGTFNADGSFKFRHKKSREVGTYTIASNGVVTISDSISGKDISFYFDASPKGKVSLVYLSGPSEGKSYALR